MSDTGPRDTAYLLHVLGAIERVRRYIGRKSRAAFLRSPLLQDAVIRNLEILGEAAGRVSPDLAVRNPAVPWRDIVGMRHRLIHGYLKVNLDTVWQAAKRDLPALDRSLRALLTGEAPRRQTARRKRHPAARGRSVK
jgi:uncharacterized protein with HEPN domain